MSRTPTFLFLQIVFDCEIVQKLILKQRSFGGEHDWRRLNLLMSIIFEQAALCPPWQRLNINGLIKLS